MEQCNAYGRGATEPLRFILTAFRVERKKRANYNKVYLNIGTSGLINGMYVRDGQTVYLDYGAVIKGTGYFQRS